MTHRKRGLIAGVLFLAVAWMPVVAVAGPFEDGKAAFDSGDYATALSLWRPLAEQGHAPAQVMLGVIYQDGQGVSQDYAEAARWYRKAAEQGHEFAENSFVLVLIDMTNMGMEAIADKDFASALRLLEPAAELGGAEAQHVLGLMYHDGLGVPQHYVQAHMWLNLAASRMPPGENRDNVVQNRDLVALLMSPAQIAEAQELAREWKPRGEQAE